jgi:hypothetical protein
MRRVSDYAPQINSEGCPTIFHLYSAFELQVRICGQSISISVRIMAHLPHVSVQTPYTKGRNGGRKRNHNAVHLVTQLNSTAVRRIMRSDRPGNNRNFPSLPQQYHSRRRMKLGQSYSEKQRGESMFASCSAPTEPKHSNVISSSASSVQGLASRVRRRIE